tara:strand:- start:23922 stop:24227 length:306 start_codon:yes stop_codon:yes gene_type:complete
MSDSEYKKFLIDRIKKDFQFLSGDSNVTNISEIETLNVSKLEEKHNNLFKVKMLLSDAKDQEEKNKKLVELADVVNGLLELKNNKTNGGKKKRKTKKRRNK